MYKLDNENISSWEDEFLNCCTKARKIILGTQLYVIDASTDVRHLPSVSRLLPVTEVCVRHTQQIYYLEQSAAGQLVSFLFGQ